MTLLHSPPKSVKSLVWNQSLCNPVHPLFHVSSSLKQNLTSPYLTPLCNLHQWLLEHGRSAGRKAWALARNWCISGMISANAVITQWRGSRIFHWTMAFLGQLLLTLLSDFLCQVSWHDSWCLSPVMAKPLYFLLVHIKFWPLLT